VGLVKHQAPASSRAARGGPRKRAGPSCRVGLPPRNRKPAVPLLLRPNPGASSTGRRIKTRCEIKHQSSLGPTSSYLENDDGLVLCVRQKTPMCGGISTATRSSTPADGSVCANPFADLLHAEAAGDHDPGWHRRGSSSIIECAVGRGLLERAWGIASLSPAMESVPSASLLRRRNTASVNMARCTSCGRLRRSSTWLAPGRYRKCRVSNVFETFPDTDYNRGRPDTPLAKKAKGVRPIQDFTPRTWAESPAARRAIVTKLWP